MSALRQFALVAALLAVGGVQAQAKTVGIATSNPGTLYHSSGTAIAKVANENGLTVTIQPATSPTQYIPVVNAGQVEFGLGNAQETADALEGKADFKGRPQSDLRAVAVMYPLKSGIWVRNNSNIKTIADLKGKNVAAGFTAQKTIIPVLQATLAAGGLTLDDVHQVPVPSVVAAANAFMSGQVDAFIFGIGAAKVREADASVPGGVRCLPIENTPANLAAIRKFFPAAYLYEQKPGPSAPGIIGNTEVIAYSAIVFTSSHVADDVVAKLAEVMSKNKDEMAQVFANFDDFDKKDMAADLGALKYHPGAIAFYKKAGLWHR